MPVKHLAAVAWISLACLWSSGCGSLKPDIDDDPPPPPRIYPARTAPESALVYLTIAWEQRDSLAADSVYAAEYTGTSIDLTDAAPETLPFTKSDEVRVFALMALDQEISQKPSMNLYPTAWVRQPNALDPPEYVTIKVPTIRIELTKGNDTYIARSTSDFFFTFRPSTTYPGLWEIIRWEEKRLS